MKKIISYIKTHKLGEVYFGKSFKELTTLKVGGKIAIYFLPYSIEAFLDFYKFASKFEVHIFIIGSGSNIFASDKKYHGIVVSFKKINILYASTRNKAIVYAGCKVSRLVYQLAKKNLGGIEFLAGIPGTLGGVVAMNAGAYGNSIADVLINALCIDRNGNLKKYTNKELKFGYRSSLVRMKDLVVLCAEIKIKQINKANILLIIDEQKQKRKVSQPLNTKNAGCVFKNPKGYYAWYLIDKVGLRGKKIGDAEISSKHANFIINKNNAKAKDIFKLMQLAKNKVFQKFNINLIYEWVLLNFNRNLY